MSSTEQASNGIFFLHVKYQTRTILENYILEQVFGLEIFPCSFRSNNDEHDKLTFPTSNFFQHNHV